MFRLIKEVFIGKTKIAFIVVAIAIIVSLVSYLATGEKENLATDIANDIIESQTGIDLDKLLPDDKTSSTITP